MIIPVFLLFWWAPQENAEFGIATAPRKRTYIKLHGTGMTQVETAHPQLNLFG